MNMENDSLIG